MSTEQEERSTVEGVKKRRNVIEAQSFDISECGWGSQPTYLGTQLINNLSIFRYIRRTPFDLYVRPIQEEKAMTEEKEHVKPGRDSGGTDSKYIILILSLQILPLPRYPSSSSPQSGLTITCWHVNMSFIILCTASRVLWGMRLIRCWNLVRAQYNITLLNLSLSHQGMIQVTTTVPDYSTWEKPHRRISSKPLVTRLWLYTYLVQW